jgi:hypothetical protein
VIDFLYESNRQWPLKGRSDIRFEDFTAVTVKSGVFWDVTPGALVRTDVSEELSASFIRVTRIGEPGTPLALTSNRPLQRASVASYS